MKRLIACFLCVLAGSLQAEEILPPTCRPIPVQNETVMLHTKQSKGANQPVLILIHNRSSADLWITHPVSEPSASAGWSTHLEAGNWSALVLNKDSFELSCIESKPGHEQQVPCTGLISACTWTAAKLPSTMSGTFWGAENKSLPAISTELGGRGVTLPLPPAENN